MSAEHNPGSIAPTVRSGSARLTVMVIASDPATRTLLPKVVQRDRLLITDDLAEGLALAEGSPPDVAFVEIGMGDGAGLALVHHLKAVVPSVTVYALASRAALEAAANAVALGGAGLIMMPVAGDDVMSAIATVKLRIADRAMRADLERAAMAYARAAGWMARVAELADSASRSAAAERLVEVLLEATGAAGAAVFLAAGDRPTELMRAAASPALEAMPPMGMEPEIIELARRENLLVVPLSIRSIKAGHVLLTPPPVAADAAAAGPRLDGLLKLLATQATTAFALLGERERSGAAVIKDPASSAYSFAYYVDVAGREIDKARRYSRRFSIATVAFEASGTSEPHPAPLSRAEMADQLLKAARDTDILAHVDEHEFHLLMPESDGLTAHACRRRVLARLTERGTLPRGLLVGVSTFPHDGQNLSQLLRVARRRAEATRYSLVRRLMPDQNTLLDLLDALGWELETPPASAVSAARAFELPIADAAALATTVVAHAVRGGATLVVVAHNELLSLGSAVRASLGPPRDNVTVHAIDVRSASPGESVEALAVIAEHGSYAFIGRSEGGTVRGIHAADPLLADVLAERLGRAAGLRLFS
ncbi:GAF domain/GGDEF domain protein [Minicystis rosea]|nr:GAF domain/GGDEF domain protein [Minicystis rosea]